MCKMWLALACLVALGWLAPPASAQSADETVPLPIPVRFIPFDKAYFSLPPELSDLVVPQGTAELEQWMDDFLEWKTWAAEWSSRREPGWITTFRDRIEKPAPPAWLSDRCETVVDDGDSLAPACGLLAEWQEDPAAARTRQARAAAQAQREETQKTIWWQHVHMDVLWPAVQWQASVYGVVGMHVATTIRGRLSAFLGPGAMLLNLPTRNGTRVWKVAANYGIGYRLFNFTFPGGRDASLHVNLAKAWLLSDIAEVASGRTTDFAGFSITFNRAR